MKPQQSGNRTTLVIGANGQIGRIVCSRLAAAGQRVRAMVRDDGQRARLEDRGAEVVVGDLEGEFEHALDGCANVVFTAGSGGRTGGDKTLLVDLWGALRTIRACEARAVTRYLMVSALRADDPDAGRQSIRHYLVAKKIADEYLARSALDYTIVRPGRLNNEPGSGRISASCRPGQLAYGEISREDVADVLIACLANDRTRQRTIDITAGDRPIAEALLACACEEL